MTVEKLGVGDQMLGDERDNCTYQLLVEKGLAQPPQARKISSTPPISLVQEEGTLI
jgi:hypothetical protein